MCKGVQTAPGIPQSYTHKDVVLMPIPNRDGQHRDYDEKKGLIL